MIPKRTGQDDENGGYGRNGDTAVMAEAVRAGGAAAKVAADVKEDEKISLFWRVFGGTILSICALVGVTLYNSLTGSISELRSEINKLNEARGEWVKKDEFNTRTATAYDRLQNLQTQNNVQNAALAGYRTEFDGLKDRLARIGSDVDAGKKDTGIILEGLRKDVIAVEAMKEKLAALAADLKATQAESQKVRQDVDKNQAADQERKAHRDAQHAEFDKAIKDLTLVVQDGREKLARLEGRQAAAVVGPPADPVPAPMPTLTLTPKPVRKAAPSAPARETIPPPRPAGIEKKN